MNKTYHVVEVLNENQSYQLFTIRSVLIHRTMNVRSKLITVSDSRMCRSSEFMLTLTIVKLGACAKEMLVHIESFACVRKVDLLQEQVRCVSYLMFGTGSGFEFNRNTGKMFSRRN